MEFTFLGTGSGQPSSHRHNSGLLVSFVETGVVWLFDAGEGTLERIQQSSTRLGHLERIFITHLHGVTLSLSLSLILLNEIGSYFWTSCRCFEGMRKRIVVIGFGMLLVACWYSTRRRRWEEMSTYLWATGIKGLFTDQFGSGKDQSLSQNLLHP